MDKVEAKLIAIWERIKRSIDEALTGTNDDERAWDDFLDKMVMIRSGQAPPFAAEGDKWIPCDKHLPPKDGTYLTTTKKGAVRTNHFYKTHGLWGYDNNAVAWRPLPEAWRAEQ